MERRYKNFALKQTNFGSAGVLQVTYQGTRLREVPKGSATDGFSWDSAKPAEICLEGDLTKDVGDRIEIYLIESNE